MHRVPLLQVKALFDEVYDLAPAERARVLARHYAPDAEPRRLLERLLEHEPKIDTFLETPLLANLYPLWQGEMPTNLSSTRLGPYRLERELGRGGMGVVYLAVRDDEVFRKEVAIKLVWPGLGRMAERFRQERQMLADLEHPHIARLLDGGTTAQGWQYLVMEYVAGTSLTAYCQEHRLSLRARLELFLDVCAAVEHAHQRFIIHRDLKPGNILVTAQGQVKLLDFGIAKALDASSYAADLSLPGTHLMTPEYASPEQLAGASLTTASDVYSLGVVLFELLTGQRPFQFASRQPHEVARVLSQHAPPRMSEAIKQRRNEERGTRKKEQPNNDKMENEPNLSFSSFIVHPSSFRGDLDNIVIRALQPEPQQRYASVAQLSEDLRRHLRGEVVQARQPTLVYRSHRFVARHKVAFSAGAAALLVLLLWLAFLLRQLHVERQQAQAQRRQLYAAEMNQALDEWQNNDLKQMQQTLARWQPQAGEEDLRGFEWGYLRRLLNASTLPLDLPQKTELFGFYPEDQRLVLGLEDQRVKILDLTTGQELHTYPGSEEGWANNAINANHLLVRMRDRRTITVSHALTGQVQTQYTHPHGPIHAFVYYNGPPACFAIAEDSGAVSIVDVATQTERFRLPGRGKAVSFFNFSVPHNLLVTVPDGRTVHIVNIVSGQPLRTFTESADIRFIEITADGKRLLLQTGESLYVRDAQTGRVLQRYPGRIRTITTHSLEHTQEVIAMGKEDGTIELCAFPSFRLLRTLHGHTRSVAWLGFTTDNQFLLSRSLDRTVRLWDWRTGAEKAVLRGHTDDILAQDFFPASGKFITASKDRTVRVWDYAEVTKPGVLHGATDHILTVAFSPDGKHVAAGGKDHNVLLYDSDTGAPTILRGHQKFVYVTRFSPDGRWLVSGSDDGTAKVRGVATGFEVGQFIKGKREYWDGVRSLAFLPDGQTLILGHNDGTVIVWDVVTNQVKTQFQAHTKEILSLALAPDARLLASSSADGTFKIWDTTTWQEKAAVRVHEGRVWTAVFSPDGNQLATGSGDQTIKLWDVATMTLQRTLSGHNDGIFQVAYTPDGKRLASVSDDGTVKLWNPQTGQELLTLRDHTNEVWGVAFSPDGRTMLTGSWDKTLRLWRTSVQYGQR